MLNQYLDVETNLSVPILPSVYIYLFFLLYLQVVDKTGIPSSPGSRPIPAMLTHTLGVVQTAGLIRTSVLSTAIVLDISTTTIIHITLFPFICEAVGEPRPKVLSLIYFSILSFLVSYSAIHKYRVKLAKLDG